MIHKKASLSPAPTLTQKKNNLFSGFNVRCITATNKRNVKMFLYGFVFSTSGKDVFFRQGNVFTAVLLAV